MNDENPYAIGRMTANGASYHGEIHAAPVLDTEHPAEPLTAPMLRMLEANWPAEEFVDAALERVRDRSLTAEVMRYRRLGPRIERQHDAIRAAERRLATLELDRNLCEVRLREAHAIRLIVVELVGDQRMNRYVQNDPQQRRRFLARQQRDFERGRSA